MQASRLASRATRSIASINAASPSTTSCNALHTSSRYNASPIQWEEIPLPIQPLKSASSEDAAATTPSKKSKGKGRAPSKRELPLRKQFLMQQYKQILTNNPVVVFLKPSDFSVEEITRLRVDLSLIPSSSSASSRPKASTSSKAEEINSEQSKKPRFVFLRAGLLPPLFEQMPHLPSAQLLSHLSRHGSNIAALTLPSLDPPSLKAALKAINKLSKTPNLRKIQAEASAAAAAAAASGKPKPSPAAGGKKGETPKEERLQVITALIEGKDMNQDEIKKLSELPSLQETLAQLVALIETPARTIHSLVSRAGGQDLVRTLEGFKLAMEEKEKPTEA